MFQAGKKIGIDSKRVILFLVLIFVIMVLSLLLKGQFLTMRNFQSMAFQFPEFGILALAMALAMITGGIDLSIISTANLVGIVAALILTKYTGPDDGAGHTVLVIFISIAAALLTSLVLGFLNGALISYVGVPAILATLATMIFYAGIGMAITEGKGVVGFPELFQAIGSGKVFNLPIPFIIFIVATFLVSLLLRRTIFGQHMYLVGANVVAARFSGINNNLVIIKTYMLTALLAGVSSLIMISRFNSAKVAYGSTYLLQAILVVVLGGVNPYGGYGKISGVVMGIILLQVLQNAFTLFEFTPYAKSLIWGLMLLLVMITNFLNTRYQEKVKIQRMLAEAELSGQAEI